MSLSVIIPVYNEEKNIFQTIKNLSNLKKKVKNLEIIIIDDFSIDKTLFILKKISRKKKNIKVYSNKKKGLGSAIKIGIEKSRNKFVSIFMADSSDSVADLEKYYKIISNTNFDAVFGSRFVQNSSVANYPFLKFFLNRIFNWIVKIIFLSDYNDFTNAFKIYKKKTLLKLFPIVSENFNVFLEIPLKIILRKYSYKIIPIKWKGRVKGKSNFRIRELSSMYIFTLFYCLLEKILLIRKK